MIFRNPFFLLLIPLVIVLLLYNNKRNKYPGIRFSSTRFFENIQFSFKVKLRKNLIFLRVISCCLLVFALSRLQTPIEDTKVQSEGIDIVLAIDCSTSMLACDFKLKGKIADRITVVKNVVENFIEERRSDRIGIVAFAGRAYTICPLTLDYSWLIKNLERVESGMMEDDGTAIGSGIVCSLNRLEDTQAKGKAVILLTDGANNAGKISPITAADAAGALGIKVYTIGVGTQGPVPYPVRDRFGNKGYQQVEIKIDEKILKEIAQITDAKYYLATDTESLRKIYQEIDKLETTSVEEKGYSDYHELFFYFLFSALFLLFLEFVLMNTILRVNP